MNYSELLQLAKGWGNFIFYRSIIWRLPSIHIESYILLLFIFTIEALATFFSIFVVSSILRVDIPHICLAKENGISLQE